jgi:hypothetical protein
MSADSSLSVRIPYARDSAQNSPKREMGTSLQKNNRIVPLRLNLSVATRRSFGPVKLHSRYLHISLLAWKQTLPEHHQKPFANKCGGVMARLLEENHLRALTSAAVPRVPIR